MREDSKGVLQRWLATRPRRRKRMKPLPRQLSLGDINEKYIKEQADRRICEDLVDIARGVLGRPDLKLEFSKGEDAYTDGITVTVPVRHKEKRLLTKHELAHIYFDSDLEMRKAFAEEMVDRLYPLSKKRHILVNSLCYLVNVLDDVRVNSCWGEVWPGDGSRMKDYFILEVGKETKSKLKIELAEGRDISLTNYLILRSVGQRLDCKWSVFDDIISDTLRSIRAQTFKALLVRSKYLLEKLIVAREKEAPMFAPTEEMDAIGVRMFTSDLGTAPPNSLDIPVSDAMKSFMEDLLNQDEEEDQEFLEIEQDEMFDRLEEINNMLDNLKGGDSTAKTDYRVNRVSLKNSDLLEPEWTSEMRIEADRWSSIFRSIVGTKVESLDTEGEMIDHQEFIQSRLMNRSSPFYKSEVTGVGFSALILVDMSGSMTGAFEQVNRLYLVLSKALALPFVDLRVVGFTSGHGVEKLKIYDFGISPKSLYTRGASWNLTPTHLILEQVPNLIANASSERHVFLLTDGWPYDGETRDDVVHAEVAYNRRAVQDLGINIHTFLIGEHAFPNDEKVDKMFGTNCWHRIPEDRLYQESFNFLAGLFVNYVRRSM